MMAIEASPHLLICTSARHKPARSQVAFMLVCSLFLHLLVLSVIGGLRLPAKVERPLNSYQVSLVSLSVPQPMEIPSKAAAPALPAGPTPPSRPKPESAHSEKAAPPVPHKPLQLAESFRMLKKQPGVAQIPTYLPPLVTPREPKASANPISRPMPKGSALPTTAASPVPPTVPKSPGRVKSVEPPIMPPDPEPALNPVPAVQAAVKVAEAKPAPMPFTAPPRKALDREILRQVTLPPDVPKREEVRPVLVPTPVESQKSAEGETHRDVERLLSQLAVPTPVASTPSYKEAVLPIRQNAPQPSVAEELQRQLQHLEKVQPSAPLSRPSPAPVLPAPTNPPVKTSLKQPATAIRASGGSGYNPYLLLVQRQISAAWVPPQVDPATQSFQVVIKFRLFRNGSVKELMIEQTSGNEYYDLAGKRAILSARLPEFPQSMPDLYLDAHFSFTVGQQFG